jgi:DNA-binding GntR family transcriptional regulator
MAKGASKTTRGKRSPVRRKAALGSSLVQSLKKRIVNWEYPPDYRLVEQRLCEEFGISRSPVREALRVLTSNGFVKKLPNGGYAVRQLHVGDIEELYGVRSALELYVVETLATGGAPESATQDLRRTWSAIKRGGRRTAEELAVLDTEFHETLARATGNAILLQHLQAINERLLVFRMIDFEETDRARSTCEQHIEILNRIAAGDSEGARSAMRRNIQEGRNNVRTAIKDALARAFAASA